MKKVTIVGVGALGSHVAMLLRNEAEIAVIDFDRIEAKNCLSQFHSKPSVGKSKAEALKQTMNFLWNVKIISLPHRLTSLNVGGLLEEDDLVIDCLDNGASRRCVQAYVTRENQACLHGALAPNGEFGRAIWTENFLTDDEDEVGTPTCEGGEFLPFISLVSSYIAFSAQQFLRHGKKMGFQIFPTGAIRI